MSDYKCRSLTHGRREISRGGVVIDSHVTVSAGAVADETIMSFTSERSAAMHVTIYLSPADLRWLAARCIEDADAIEKDQADAEAKSAAVPVCAMCLGSSHCGSEPDFPWRPALDGEVCGAADHDNNVPAAEVSR